MRKYQILVIHSYTIDLNKILTIEFFTNDKTHLRWWLDALVYVLLHSVGSSTDLLHADFAAVGEALLNLLEFLLFQNCF